MSLSIYAFKTIIAVFIGLMILAAVIDFRDYKIPNFVTFALLALYPSYVAAAPFDVAWLPSLAIGAGFFAVGAGFYAVKLIGGGDVKLLAVGGLWAGPGLALDFVLVTTVTGGLFALFLLSPLGRGLALVADAAGRARVRDFLLNDVLPYGVAIAAGGVFVGWMLLRG